VTQTKPFDISKSLLWEAYQCVKANRGSAGIDQQSLDDFDQDLKNNLYKLWNRMASGSYFPQPVKHVEIPKVDGGQRVLGIPTVADRIAQTAVKLQIEAELEQRFHPDSYGYRPNKSAHQALARVRERCWQRPWVIDMDIKAFFDEIDHDLLLKAVDKHVHEAWQRLYIKRWLEQSEQKGTPQGGVISPLLANLFLHYVFDVWVETHCEGIQFVRYADDIIVHCRTEDEAQRWLQQLTQRFAACGLTLHPQKTQIVYCKSWKHTADYERIGFDFLGYTFRPRQVKNAHGELFLGFVPAVSRQAAKRIRAEMKSWNWRAWEQADIQTILRWSQRKIRGWMAYYGRFGQHQIRWVLSTFDQRLVRWAKRKYKITDAQAWRRVLLFRKRQPQRLAHWSNC